MDSLTVPIAILIGANANILTDAPMVTAPLNIKRGNG